MDADRPPPANVNLDVGAATAPGTYGRADAAWADLCTHLAAADFKGADPPLTAAILAHYSGPATAVTPPALAAALERLQERPLR